MYTSTNTQLGSSENITISTEFVPITTSPLPFVSRDYSDNTLQAMNYQYAEQLK